MAPIAQSNPNCGLGIAITSQSLQALELHFRVGDTRVYSEVKLDRKPSVSNLVEESDVELTWWASRLDFIFRFISKLIGLTFPDFGSNRMV